MTWISSTEAESSVSQLFRLHIWQRENQRQARCTGASRFDLFASAVTSRSPEAVAGPTPFRALSSAMAACTSGRRLKAFLEHFSTVSSLLEATSCCSLGLNFPLCRGNKSRTWRRSSTGLMEWILCHMFDGEAALCLCNLSLCHDTITRRNTYVAEKCLHCDWYRCCNTHGTVSQCAFHILYATGVCNDFSLWPAGSYSQLPLHQFHQLRVCHVLLGSTWNVCGKLLLVPAHMTCTSRWAPSPKSHTKQ